MNTKLEVLFDWIEFTIHDKPLEFVILQVLNLELADFIELDHGRYGYSEQKILGNISALYNNMRKDMGIHIILSGKGCREYETNNNIADLLFRVESCKGKLTRMDIAIDDVDGHIIDFNKILADVQDGNIISRWKNSIEITKRDMNSGSIIGHTINFGSRKSDLMMRLYNKGMETEENPSWIRLELEIKKKKAQKLNNILINTTYIGPIVAKVINNYIRFVNPSSKDSNKSRWQTREYWLNILMVIDKLSLSSKGKERSIEDIKSWIIRQVAPSLALILIDEQGDLSEIMSIIREGKKRMKAKHYKML